MAITVKTRKRDGVKTYYIDFRDQKRRRVREIAGTTRTQAKDLLTKRLGEVRAGSYVNPKDLVKAADRGPTFSEFAARFVRDYAKLRRSNHYNTNLKPLLAYFGTKHLREITRTDLDLFAVHRSGNVGRSTLRKNLTVLCKVFRMAVRWGVIDASPAVDLQKPSEPIHKTRYLSREEWDRLHDAASPWLQPILTVSVATGMRLKEVVGLRWEDVDTKTRLLYIGEDNKTGTPRAVPMTEAVLGVIAERAKVVDIRTGKHLSVYVFTDDAGNNYTTPRLRNLISQRTGAAMKAAKIEGASFHTLRHTAASWMVQGGTDLLRVQKILGHSTPLMTQRYSHLRPDDLLGAVAPIDAILSRVDTQMDTSPSPTTPSANAPTVNPSDAVTSGCAPVAQPDRASAF